MIIALLFLLAQPVPKMVEWPYDFTSPAYNQACSTTITVNCVEGFKVAAVENSEPSVYVWDATVLASTLPAVNGPQTISIPYAGPTTDLGTYTISVQVLYRDKNGIVKGGLIAANSFSIPDGVESVRLSP